MPRTPAPHSSPFCPLPHVSASSDEGLHYQKDTLSLLARCGPDAGTPFSARIPFNVPVAPSEHLRANQKLLTWAMIPYWRIWRLKKKNKQRFSRGRGEQDNEDRSVFFFFLKLERVCRVCPPWMMTSKVGSLLGQVTHTALASGLYLIFHC